MVNRRVLWYDPPSRAEPAGFAATRKDDYREVHSLARTPRTWQGARSPSGLKRVRQTTRRREILLPRRSAAKTLVAKALRVSAAPVDGQDPAVALVEALSALDRAAKAGAIHANAAARRKSRLVRKVNTELGGATVKGAHVAKQTSKAQAAKAAKARIAAGRADKAKGAQTAAGKARAALTRTTRTEGAEPNAPAKPAAETARKTTSSKPKPAATRPASRSTSKKTGPKA